MTITLFLVQQIKKYLPDLAKDITPIIAIIVGGSLNLLYAFMLENPTMSYQMYFFEGIKSACMASWVYDASAPIIKKMQKSP